MCSKIDNVSIFFLIKRILKWEHAQSESSPFTYLCGWTRGAMRKRFLSVCSSSLVEEDGLDFDDNIHRPDNEQDESLLWYAVITMKKYICIPKVDD